MVLTVPLDDSLRVFLVLDGGECTTTLTTNRPLVFSNANPT